MIHSAAQIAADAAELAAHRCPECHSDLKPMNRVQLAVHVALEFPHGDDPTLADSDYARRHHALLAYHRERFKEAA